ncbi:hypothetical protein [Kitasatospora sp. NPDC093806]|uniref:hypothetical protein n=1 Tax=Kitasatospora sp. NPDC093806 TaxID=3155075 RepID=UPI003416C178
MAAGNGSAAEIFADRDFKGASLALAAGNYNLESDGGLVGNDAISSIKVKAGYVVTVYANADGTGASTTFTDDTPYVGDDFDDTISSLRVQALPENRPRREAPGRHQHAGLRGVPARRRRERDDRAGRLQHRHELHPRLPVTYSPARLTDP